MRNEVAKVMFLQACVCPRGGGVCLSACWDTTSAKADLLRSRPPLGADTPQSRHPPRADTPRSRHPPEQTPLRERQPLLRTVRILLECILILNQNIRNRAKLVTDPFAPKFYSLTQNDVISPNIADGLNFVTCEQTFTVPCCSLIFIYFLGCSAQACVVAFSTSDRDSFDAVNVWKKKVRIIFCTGHA